MSQSQSLLQHGRATNFPWRRAAKTPPMDGLRRLAEKGCGAILGETD
jgi:hypothetical protein